MNIEEQVISSANLTAQQERFNTEAQSFGQLYSRRQSMTSIGSDLLRRMSGQRTIAQETEESMLRLNEARLNLAEARARFQVGVTSPNDRIYRESLADAFAREYITTAGEITVAIQDQNTNLGFLDSIYRFNMSRRGAMARLAIGAYMFAGGVTQDMISFREGLIDGGIFLMATGAMDYARHALLGRFHRNRTDLAASTATLSKRSASIEEGFITGDDEIEYPQALSDTLVDSLSDEVLSELELKGVTRPVLPTPLAPINMAQILKQREALRNRVGGYNEINELVRSRDVARTSRLTRTLFYTALALSLLICGPKAPEPQVPAPFVGPVLSPNFCGSRVFSVDTDIQNLTGIPDASSWEGIAEGYWFYRQFNRQFNRQSAADQEAYGLAYGYDPLGNDEIVRELTRKLKAKNQGNVDSKQKDLLDNTGVVQELCPDEVDEVFNTSSQ